VMSNDELADICRWCEKNGVRLISDEIYHGINFGDTNHSALEHSSSAVVMNSFSKYFAMTGHRIGWIIAPDNLVDPLIGWPRIVLFLLIPYHRSLARRRWITPKVIVK